MPSPLPSGVELLASESLTFHPPATLEDARTGLARLCGAASAAGIGQHGPVVAAGAIAGEHREQFRLYEVLFARDALTVADLLQGQYPQLSVATVAALAPLVAQEYDSASEAEPGRVPHEVREPTKDPIAQELTANHGWGWPYYGSVDSTVLLVLAATRVLNHNRAEASRPIERNGHSQPLIAVIAEAANWVAQRCRQSRSGLIESIRSQPGGTINQVWKDSPDSYHHTDGSLATADTVSSVELAARTVDALVAIEQLAQAWPEQPWPSDTRALREIISDRIRHELTRADGSIMLGFDRDSHGRERKLDVVSSNAGWVLDSSVLDNEPGASARLAASFQDPAILAAAGVRTLAEGQARYYPGGYHNGSVWPFDTALIARGLARHGQHTQARDLAQRVITTCQTLRCYPELVVGASSELIVSEEILDVRDRRGGPQSTLEHRLTQPPQQIQAWTLAAYLWAEQYLSA